MTSVLIQRGNLNTEDAQKEEDVKRHRDKTTIYKPRRKAKNRSFPHNLT